jgi:tetratricopeptide (TPR) repeat protein/CHAT domain-containing protein
MQTLSQSLMAIFIATIPFGSVLCQSASDVNKVADFGSAVDKIYQLYQQRKYADAIPLAEGLLKRLAAEGDTQYSEFFLNTLALLYEQQGMYAKAEQPLARVLEIRERTLNPEHPDVANAVLALANAHFWQGEYDKAEPLFLRAVALRKKALGPDHPDTLKAVSNLASEYQARAAYTLAEPLFQRVIAVKERLWGVEHPETAKSMSNLAGLYHAEGAFDKAEALLLRALAIEEVSLGPDHSDTLITVNNLAEVYRSRGAYKLAEPLYQRALTTRERLLGPEAHDTAISLGNLAELYRTEGNYSKAEPLYTRALAALEKTVGRNHPDTAITLSNLASLYFEQGMYLQAEPLLQSALTINERGFGPEHPSTANSLNNLGALYLEQGMLPKAEEMLSRALAIREASLGSEHRDTVSSLNNMAILYAEQGLYDRAEPLLVRALASSEKKLGPNHPETAGLLDGLGELYANQGDFGRAEPLLTRALSIREAALGKGHLQIAKSLNNIAALYASQGLYKRAESFYRRALTISEGAVGTEHPQTATALNNLAMLYFDQARYRQAEPLFRKALEIREKMLGPDHPDTLIVQQNLGAMLAASGKSTEWPQALDLLGRVLNSTRELDLIAFGKRAEQRSALGRTLSLFSVLAAKAPRDSKLASSWRKLLLQAALNGKARTADELRAAVEAAGVRGNSKLLQASRNLKNTWQAIGNLNTKGPSEIGLIPYRDKLVQLYSREEDLLDELSAGSSAVRDAREVESRTSLKSIADRLQTGDALVEIVEYKEWIPKARRGQEKLRTLYGAVTLYPSADRPDLTVDWIKLGSAEQINKLVHRYLRSVRTPDNNAVSVKVQASLRQLVFKKITNRTGRSRRLLISPDAELRLIPWNTMLADPLDGPELVMLPTGRDIVRWSQVEPSEGVDVVTGVSRFGDPRPENELVFRDLPGVEIEVAAVRDALKLPQIEHVPVTKAWLLATVNSPRVLHLATHGYYQIDRYTEDPMLRSGIALENANEQAEDGRLTAKEAAGLNLRGTQLATLSACESGVGEANFADGLLGLQRSLEVAGARSVLLTLWPVDDLKTAEFMKAYYLRLTGGEGKAEALRRVQSEMKMKGEPQHYWAPFVLYGDPEPLK